MYLSGAFDSCTTFMDVSWISSVDGALSTSSVDGSFGLSSVDENRFVFRELLLSAPAVLKKLKRLWSFFLRRCRSRFLVESCCHSASDMLGCKVVLPAHCVPGGEHVTGVFVHATCTLGTSFVVEERAEGFVSVAPCGFYVFIRNHGWLAQLYV